MWVLYAGNCAFDVRVVGGEHVAYRRGAASGVGTAYVPVYWLHRDFRRDEVGG